MTAPDWLVDEAILAPVSAQFLTPGTELIARDDWIQVIRPHAPTAMMNEVIYSRVYDDGDIDGTIGRYASIPTSFKWSVPATSTPEDLGERLRSRGMTSWWARAMWCPTDLLVDGELVDVSDDPDRYAEVSGRTWELDPDGADSLRAGLRWAADTGRFGLFLTPDAAGSAAVVASARSGYLMGAAVLPEARGRGHYRALLAGRLRWLQGRNIEYAVTLAREATSAPILERRGFQTLFRYEVFQWDPPTTSPPAP